MTPLIVSSKVATILAIAFATCLNHTHYTPDGKTFDPGFQDCPRIIAAYSRSETVEQARAAAKQKAEDEAAVAAAEKQLQKIKDAAQGAARAKGDPVDWSKFKKEAAQAAASAAHGPH